MGSQAGNGIDLNGENSRTKVQNVVTHGTAHFRTLNDFLSGLKETQEQGASLLDRTACLYGTNMGSANAHSNDNLPVLLVGSGFKPAGHLAFDQKNNYPLSNLYVSLLQRIGVESDTFASGTGTMRGLEML